MTRINILSVLSFCKLKNNQKSSFIPQRSLILIGISVLMVASFLVPVGGVQAQNGAGGSNNSSLGECEQESAFLTFPVWYRGLQCDDGGTGAPVFSELNDVWAVAANILDILIQLAGIAAVGFIIYGGIRYIISQGDPENVQGAKKIIANAIIGLVLAIMASTIVGFIAGSFS